MNKRIKILTKSVLTLFAIFLMNPISLAAPQKLQSLDRIVAVVNETIITQTELNDRMAQIKKQMLANNVPLPPAKVMRKEVLEQIVNKTLQMQFAQQQGIKITDPDLDKAIETIATNNKISVPELYQKIQEQGVPLPEYRKEIREELTLQRIQHQNVDTKFKVTPQEINAFMQSPTWQGYSNKEYQLEDLLIPLSEKPTPQEMLAAKKKASDLVVKVRRGLSFQEVAAANESAQNTAVQAGDLGWRKLSEIPTIFAESLIRMKDNDILGPIKTPNGFHIIKLTGTRSAGATIDLAEQRTQVEQLIFQQKYEENLRNWVIKLRSGAFVSIIET